MNQKVKQGDLLKFAEEKQMYTVRACDERYAICTKPFNLQKTVFYTIVDFTKGIRSTNDHVFNPYDYTNQKDIDRSLIDLQNSKYKLSQRHKIKLNIERIVEFNNKKEKIS
jgi:hypothetical protein